MEYKITIAGSGTSEQIAQALQIVALSIRIGQHVKDIEDRGRVEWEDEILFTEITEYEDGTEEEA